MELNLVSSSFECIQHLKSATYKTLDELLLDMDSHSIIHRFKMTKKNGDKNYVYLQCYKSGSARSIPEEEKKRHASSQKQSITIYFP